MGSRMFDVAKAIVLASFPEGLTEMEIKARLCERFYGDEIDNQCLSSAPKILATRLEIQKEWHADTTLEEGVIATAEIDWLGGTEEARKRLGGLRLVATVAVKP